MGELLSKLEKKGYNTRNLSLDDKRIIIVHLTEARANADDGEIAQSELVDIFSCLSVEEQTAFKGYLDRLIVSLEDRYGDKGMGRRRARRGFTDCPQGLDG